MSYPPSSPDGALIQIAITLGRMEQRQADQARSLDTLIRILQEQTLSQSQKPAVPPPSRRSMLGPIAEKIGGKLSADLAMRLLWRVAQVAIPYLLPWAIVLWGLAKGLLKYLGVS